jgi:hypothetical protein
MPKFRFFLSFVYVDMIFDLADVNFSCLIFTYKINELFLNRIHTIHA